MTPKLHYPRFNPSFVRNENNNKSPQKMTQNQQHPSNPRPQKSPRPLLIPTKRPLHPPTPTPTRPRTLNPSSNPTDLQLRRPPFSTIATQYQDQNQDQSQNQEPEAEAGAKAKQHGQDGRDRERERDRQETLVAAVDFSCPAQPFLDVGVWERWCKRVGVEEKERMG